MQPPEEKLGSFYLGAEYDPAKGARTDKALYYDARDLTTHAVCVGMTGSGKTGLCIGLLEEAVLDRIPVLLIDPKGDMTNMLLQFPDLNAEDFRPWINEDDAERKGKTADEFASATAELWKNGLADWGMGPDRLRKLKESADYTIYTPGSESGVPLSILGSLKAPAGLNFEEHAETVRERISGTVTALLGLAGLDADPVRSREAILLSGIFEHFWKEGHDLDLSSLIMSVQKPPMRQIGVFDIDTFFPEKERFELAISFNTILASPSFQSWLSGDPLDISMLLYTPEGKPRVSICYLAHLSDTERMFFVTLLLENLLTWVRAQSGTSSLRALLYFDEVFGFLPPVAEPSSKRPLLTLLKQARAFGVGCVLVTQNPVDLDYKGLTNTGTWFIGKLQAERDKMRVLEGLKSAIAEAGGSGDIDYDSLISQLGNRVFLMHNVHEDRPVIFQTRWAMSYLSGPMTRPQIQQLMKGRKKNFSKESSPHAHASVPADTEPFSGQRVKDVEPGTSQVSGTQALPTGFSELPPVLDPGMKQVFLRVSVLSDRAEQELARQKGVATRIFETRLVYQPSVLGAASVMFSDRKLQVNEQEDFLMVFQSFTATLSKPDWNAAERLFTNNNHLMNSPESPDNGCITIFASVPEQANNPKKLSEFGNGLADWLYYNSRRKVAFHKELDLFQLPEEDERDFRIRLHQAAREKRDDEIDALEKKFKPRIDKLRDRAEREERELARDEAEHRSRKTRELVGIGETVLGLFLGRKSSRAVSSAIGNRRMTANAREDVEESHESLLNINEEIERCSAEMKESAEEISRQWERLEEGTGTEEIAPRKSDISVNFVALAWLPFWRISYAGNAGESTFIVPAYETGAAKS
ncbi:MAG: ATP-binding protein [Chlorobiaceae bacterium]|nr:ATP-binding protein [Chlorobiaceae bacterium]NTV61445.1 ATP-binding protein [Chlorobiaceae bacterium]